MRRTVINTSRVTASLLSATRLVRFLQVEGVEPAPRPTTSKRPKATPAPAKTGHHFAGIRKWSAAPAWLGGHNVRVCPTAHNGGNDSHPARASVECSRRIAAWMHG
jgi:hypothetical protein